MIYNLTTTLVTPLTTITGTDTTVSTGKSFSDFTITNTNNVLTLTMVRNNSVSLSRNVNLAISQVDITTGTSATLLSNVFYTIATSADFTLSLGSLITGVKNIFSGQITVTVGTDPVYITFPSGLKWNSIALEYLDSATTIRCSESTVLSFEIVNNLCAVEMFYNYVAPSPVS